MTKEEERREACQGQAKEKDGPEDGGESRNSKCGRQLADMMVERKVDIGSTMRAGDSVEGEQG